jgi:hypothetical protein
MGMGLIAMELWRGLIVEKEKLSNLYNYTHTNGRCMVWD